MEDIDLKPLIRHPAILNRSRSRTVESLSSFSSSNPVLILYTDQSCHVGSEFTCEKWRRIWFTMISLCFDIRDEGFIVSPATFQESNMSIVDNQFLRFEELKGRPLSDQNFTDFHAIANFLQSLILPQMMPLDVVLFHNLLRSIGPSNLPADIHTKAMLKCNYALMPDSMRRDFVIRIWDDARAPGSRKCQALKTICSNLDRARCWPRIACRVHNSPISVIYAEGLIRGSYNNNQAYPQNLVKFIRNALVHLLDVKHNYSAEEAIKTITSCFTSIVPRLQWELFQAGALEANELYMYEPSAY